MWNDPEEVEDDDDDDHDHRHDGLPSNSSVVVVISG